MSAPYQPGACLATIDRLGPIRLLAALLVCFSLCSCTTKGAAVGSGFSRFSVQNHNEVKLVLLKPSVVVYELPTTGMPERVPEWSDKAAINVFHELKMSTIGGQIIRPDRGLELSKEQMDTIDEHLALYYQVASAALITGQGNHRAWAHKKGSGFDYTLGSGLAFLEQETGADAALIVIAEDYISTGGRKTVAALGALVGAYVPLGQSFMAIGMVDLSTGNIAWANFIINNSGADLRQADDVKGLINSLLETYH